VLSIVLPIPIYYNDSTRFLTAHNTSWISRTFIVMAVPVAVAFLILMTNQRHIGPRHSLSDTQRIFTSSWWVGDHETLPSRDPQQRRQWQRSSNNSNSHPDDPEPDDMLGVSTADQWGRRRRTGSVAAAAIRKQWLPASFVRFLWFCVALFIGLMAYVLGEAYAEIYLRTLPHDNFETVVYVWGWVVTVHLLDILTGWVLGIREGERVGSYPLSWVFKL
jgi:hypothetical protein